jgi:glycosyltransferase involved in cell wall biosynthesis
MSNRQLNILFLASWYPNKAIPTLGNFIQRHAEAVATRHHVTVLYVCLLADQQEKWKVEESLENGVRTILVYGKKGKFGWWKKILGFRKGIEWLKKGNRFQFDLVHQNVIWPDGWQAWWLKRKEGIPYVITEHWTGFDQSIRNDQSAFLKPLAKLVAGGASAICPVTNNLAEVMRKFGLQGRYVIVPNVVDTSIFHPAQIAGSTQKFLHVSTLNDAHKNISGILRVWKKVSDRYPDIHLEIGGEGDIRHYSQVADKLGIRKTSLTFFGEKKWREIAKMMSVSHTLILFSNYENLPCVVVEAMASGMTIISTDVGGIKEHVTSDHGILIPRGDENALEEAISEMVQHHHRFDRKEITEYGNHTFSNERVAELYTSVYNLALGNKKN